MDELTEEGEADFLREQMELEAAKQFGVLEKEKLMKEQMAKALDVEVRDAMTGDVIKKCQAAVTKKLIDSMNEVASKVVPNVRKTGNPFIDLGEIQLSGVLPTDRVTIKTLDKSKEEYVWAGVSPMDVLIGKNPCAEIELPDSWSISVDRAMQDLTDNTVKTAKAVKETKETLEELEKENKLAADELAVAHKIEDHIEDWLAKNYSSERSAYTIDLPVPATPRVYEFISKRMYNWAIVPETDTKWILRWR